MYDLLSISYQHVCIDADCHWYIDLSMVAGMLCGLTDLYHKTKDETAKRDYLYYLSVGHCRLKVCSLKIISLFFSFSRSVGSECHSLLLPSADVLLFRTQCIFNPGLGKSAKLHDCLLAEARCDG